MFGSLGQTCRHANGGVQWPSTSLKASCKSLCDVKVTQCPQITKFAVHDCFDFMINACNLALFAPDAPVSCPLL